LIIANREGEGRTEQMKDRREEEGGERKRGVGVAAGRDS